MAKCRVDEEVVPEIPLSSNSAFFSFFSLQPEKRERTLIPLLTMAYGFPPFSSPRSRTSPPDIIGVEEIVGFQYRLRVPPLPDRRKKREGHRRPLEPPPRALSFIPSRKEHCAFPFFVPRCLFFPPVRGAPASLSDFSVLPAEYANMKSSSSLLPPL